MINNVVLPGTRFIPPQDFPVFWERSGDDQYYWTRDCEHNPGPITPMFSSTAALTASAGRQPTVSAYDESILARVDCTINTYDYNRVIVFQGPPDEMERRINRNREKMMAVCEHLSELWESEWRPAIEAHWDFWSGFDLESANWNQLKVHLQATLERMTQLYEIHYRMGPPMWFAIEEFEQFYCDVFTGSTALDAHRCLQGFDNKTLQISRALWDLNRVAKSNPAVRRVIENFSAKSLAPVLAVLPEAQEFLAQLAQFLRTYGRRSDLWDWGYPSWEEDPTPVFNNLKNYLAQPDRDLLGEMAATADERETALSHARQKLDGYPKAIRQRFESLLNTAQVALVLTEDHTYYIDFNGFGWAHRVIRQFGQRLADQGRLDTAEDVFYLTIQELQCMTTDLTLDYTELAANRRAEAVYWSAYPAPRALGTRPASALNVYSADARRMARYLGAIVDGDAEDNPPALPAHIEFLRGQPGAAGRVCGTARVIRSLADAQRLQPGEILVTTTTAPPWTPLFLTAAGLVTDAGGLLSHGAVVAREYRIPAVVGTRFATQVIRDGQAIEVDGNQGWVRILSGG
jgi:pyruvate,water dikinase